MNTTEFIGILQGIQFGGITKKPREISFTVNGRYIDKPSISINSTGDGFLGAEVDIAVDGDIERCEKEVDEITIGKAEPLKVDTVTLLQAFRHPSWMKLFRENCPPDRFVDVRMTHEDLKIIVDLANDKRERQQKSGINIVRTDEGFELRCNRCGRKITSVLGLHSFEEVEKKLEGFWDDLKLEEKFCMACGNDLRGKVHYT